MERNNTEEAGEDETDEMRQLWRSEFKIFIFTVLINLVLCVAVIALMYLFGAPLIYGILPDPWSGIVTAIVTLLLCGPFIWALMKRGGNSEGAQKLWNEGGHVERIKMTAFGILRLVLGAAIIAYIIGNTLPKSGLLGIFAVIAVACWIFLSPKLEQQSNKMVKTFTENLNEREQSKS
jgi:CPA2 family monovalent cation:H+ antiporter-2